MEFELTDGFNSIMTISAETEDKAWKKLRRAGIYNKSKMFNLIKIEEM